MHMSWISFSFYSPLTSRLYKPPLPSPPRMRFLSDESLNLASVMGDDETSNTLAIVKEEQKDPGLGTSCAGSDNRLPTSPEEGKTTGEGVCEHYKPRRNPCISPVPVFFFFTPWVQECLCSTLLKFWFNGEGFLKFILGLEQASFATDFISLFCSI